MKDKYPEGYIELRHPVDAVPTPKFAEMIGKSANAVGDMVRDGKLPVVQMKNPEALTGRSENWIYILNLTALCVTPISTARKSSATLGCCGLGFEVIAMSQKAVNHENRVRECNDILDTHLKDMQTGFMIRTNNGEFMIRDKKLIKKITKDVARHVDGELLKLGM